MNAISSVLRSPDDIMAFLPGISDEEYALRRRIRSARNVASFALNSAPEGIARDLFILLRDHADQWTYRPASLATLKLAVEQCQRLYVATQAAEDLEDAHG